MRPVEQGSTNEQPVEEVSKKLVEKNPNVILTLPNPSEDLKKRAIKKIPRLVLQMENPTKELREYALRLDGLMYPNMDTTDFEETEIRDILIQGGTRNLPVINPALNYEECLAMAGVDAFIVEKIPLEYVTDELIEVCIKTYPPIIKRLSNLKQEQLDLAVSLVGSLIKDMPEATEETQLKAVRQNGKVLHSIKKPSLEVQKEAVRQNPHVIEGMKKITGEIAEIAMEGFKAEIANKLK